MTFIKFIFGVLFVAYVAFKFEDNRRDTARAAQQKSDRKEGLMLAIAGHQTFTGKAPERAPMVHPLGKSRCVDANQVEKYQAGNWYISPSFSCVPQY